jgi:CRP/FNR family cyclic AMP-dependent transcriptional regulator
MGMSIAVDLRSTSVKAMQASIYQAPALEKYRIEEDVVDQLFNAAEKRLARTLLRLTGYGKQEKPERMIPGISQEILAEMIGTTRPRVNFFMNKFRKLGFIDYDGRPPWLQINESFLNFLRD